MKDAAYQCPKEVADHIEEMRALLKKHYGADGYTFLIAVTGKLIAAGNRPLAGGDVRSKPTVGQRLGIDPVV